MIHDRKFLPEQKFLLAQNPDLFAIPNPTPPWRRPNMPPEPFEPSPYQGYPGGPYKYPTPEKKARRGEQAFPEGWMVSTSASHLILDDFPLPVGVVLSVSSVPETNSFTVRASVMIHSQAHISRVDAVRGELDPLLRRVVKAVQERIEEIATEWAWDEEANS